MNPLDRWRNAVQRNDKIREAAMTTADTTAPVGALHRVVRAEITDPVWDEYRGVVLMPRTYSEREADAAMVGLVRERGAKHPVEVGPHPEWCAQDDDDLDPHRRHRTRAEEIVRIDGPADEAGRDEVDGIIACCNVEYGPTDSGPLINLGLYGPPERLLSLSETEALLAALARQLEVARTIADPA